MVLGLLHDSATYIKGLGYLIFYNIIFVAPLVVILFLASNKALVEKVGAWRKTESKAMRLWAGAAMIGYGAFLTAVINFVILAFIIFLLVRYTTKTMAQIEKKEEEAPAEPVGPTEIDLLTEIRDALKK